jgi:WD40 repeat protein
MSSESRVRAARIFLVYADEDQKFYDDLSTHLTTLQRQGIIDDWHEQKIAPASNRDSANNELLSQADLILLLITPDFIASDYQYSIQMQRALERHNAGSARVIPILCRTSLWQELPFAVIQALPCTEQRVLKAINEWSNPDKAYVTIVAGIQQTIDEIPWLTVSPAPPNLASSAASPSQPAFPNPAPPPKPPVVPRGTLHLTYHGHSTYLIDVAWSPDGQFIASGGGDSTVRVWHAKTGATIYTHRGQKGTTLSGILFSEIWSIVWSPDSTMLAFAGKGAPIVWKPSDDRQVSSYHGHSSFLPTISSMAWSPDGQFIASTNLGSLKDQALHVWLPDNGMQSAKFDVSSGFFDTSPIGGVTWSSDSTRLACGLHGEIRIYDIRTKRHLQTYKHKAAWAYYCVCWTPDEKLLIGSYPKQAVVWNTITGKMLYTYNDHSADIRDIAISPDGNYVASASNDTNVHIWEAATGKRVFKYEGHKNEVAALTWSPDGTRIASACKDGTVHVWQAT